MVSLDTYARNVVIDALMRNQPFVGPAALYVALVTTMGISPTLAGVEVSGGSYTRVLVPASLAAWAATQGGGITAPSSGTSGASSNNADITFPRPTANWGTIVGFELWDSPGAGHRWMFGTLTIPKSVSLGDPAISFPAGELVIALA